MVPGDKVEIQIAAKGGGSENKTKMVMLNPSDDIAEWVRKRYQQWARAGVHQVCLALVLVVRLKSSGIGKESLMEHIDIQELIDRGPQNAEEELRLDIFNRVNKLGIGARSWWFDDCCRR